MKISKCLITLFLIVVMSLTVTVFDRVEAAGIKNLKENKAYSYNLDKKGAKEKISFSMNKKGIYKIKINGKIKKRIKLGKDFYSPSMQICDIDKKDGKMDIWVYAYTDSDDIRYSALYQYSKGKIKRIWNLTEDYNSDNEAYTRRCGFLVDIDGKGNFTIAMDRAVNNGFLTGNHIDRVKFNLKRGKVTQVTKHTYYFYKAYNLAGGKGKCLSQRGRWFSIKTITKLAEMSL